MGNVKLVAMTKPMIEGVDTPEQFIAYCARVSNPSNQLNNETAEKLLTYCVKNKHWSIFETVNIVLEIQTTRDIGRQILRHRSFSFQEFSQRYAAVVNMSEPREARLQDAKNRQNSIEMDEAKKHDLMTADILEKDFLAAQQAIIDTVVPMYQDFIKRGIAKEQARIFLPEGLTMSHMYMSGSLRSWITYIAMREKNGTQKEHREIALECKRLLSYEFPSVSQALSNELGEWIV